MSLFRQIIEGWRNDLIPPARLKEVIDEVYKERLEICKVCEAYDSHGRGCAVPGTAPCCNNRFLFPNGVFGCGCQLNKKLKCLSCKCPVNKWGAIVSEGEEEILNKT